VVEITLTQYLIAIGAAIAGGYAILWILNFVHKEYPKNVEETWIELKRVKRDEWCTLMSDSGYRRDWERWFKNMKERQ